MPDSTAKQKVLEAIERLPADATVEDAIERLVLLAKIEQRLGPTRCWTTGRAQRGKAPAAPVTQIIWAPQAIEDVEAIRGYVARDSPRSADLLVERILSAVEHLETDPLSGRVVPEIGKRCGSRGDPRQLPHRVSRP